MHKKLLKRCLFFLMVILLFLPSLTSCGLANAKELVIHSFATIQECQEIINRKSEDAEVLLYNLPAQDRNLKGLEYKEGFGCKYTSKEFNFEIFAYEFFDHAGASRYYENVNGNITISKNPKYTFHGNGNLFRYRRVVLDDNKAYVITCKTKDKQKVIDFINSIFTIDMDEYFHNGSE